MDRNELKRIIIEEIRKSLAEPPPAAPGSRSPEAETPGGKVVESPQPTGRGILLLTGSEPPSAGLLSALPALVQAGGELRAILSWSFRQHHSGGGVLPVAVSEIANTKTEREIDGEIFAAGWILVPDVSSNTLNKTALGIEDSIPSRAIGLAVRSGKPCVFVECLPSPPPTVELSRLELIRKLERRGARLACPDSLLRVLHEATRPPEEKFFRPPPVRPSPRRLVITGDDVYEAAKRGQKELRVPADAIVTSLAYEDAVRRGLTIRREE